MLGKETVGRMEAKKRQSVSLRRFGRNPSKLLNKKGGVGPLGLVNSALTALYRVPITTDTLLYAYFDVQFPYEKTL